MELINKIKNIFKKKELKHPCGRCHKREARFVIARDEYRCEVCLKKIQFRGRYV